MKSSFGERLRTAIKTRGVTANWIADEAETSTANLSRYMSGASDPEILNIIVRIADALNVSVDYLVGATDIMLPAARKVSITNEFSEHYGHLFSDPNFQMYVSVYNAMPPKARAFLTELVRAYGINQNVLAADGTTVVNPVVEDK